MWFRCLCLITMVLGNLCTRTPMATRLCFGALAMFAPYLPPSFAREFSRPTFRSFTSILDDIVFAESVLRDSLRNSGCVDGARDLLGDLVRLLA